MAPILDASRQSPARCCRRNQLGRNRIASLALLLAAAGACSLPADRGGSMETQSSLETNLRAIAEASRGVEKSVEILEYVLDIQEVKVLGDHAYQWGTYRYRMRPRTGG